MDVKTSIWAFTETQPSSLSWWLGFLFNPPTYGSTHSSFLSHQMFSLARQISVQTPFFRAPFDYLTLNFYPVYDLTKYAVQPSKVQFYPLQLGSSLKNSGMILQSSFVVSHALVSWWQIILKSVKRWMVEERFICTIVIIIILNSPLGNFTFLYQIHSYP